jgi:hypothetical protein
VGFDESAGTLEPAQLRDSLLEGSGVELVVPPFSSWVAADGDRILGFTMFGADAGEVMAVVQTAMLAGMPYTGLRDAILAHPTMAEGLGGLFSNVPAR